MLQGKIRPVILSAISVVVLSSGVVPGRVHAQAQQPAQQQQPAQPAAAAPKFSMADVMTKIRALREAETRLIREREASFRKAMEDQERLARETAQKRDAAEARSASLSKQYDDNYNRIGEMQLLLEQHQGNLGELFGVTRQIAGDVAGMLDNSIVNAEIRLPDGEEHRVDFLRRVASAKELPSILELERLWLEILYEIRADAQTARFTAPVERPDGSVVDTQIVRVGSFTVVGNGKFLGYVPSQRTVIEMTRQPPQLSTISAVRDLQNAPNGTGYIRSIVDPARGVLVGLIAERPNVLERIQNGEAVNWVILAVGFMGLVAAIFQYGYLFIVKLAVGQQLKNLSKPTQNNPLGRMLLAAGNTKNELPELTELRISESVLREVPKLERFQSFLRLVVAAGPLLGLIGTVIGMILTFQSITASGTSDPKLMAHGIGMAMIATVLGLGIAIPLLFINAGLAALSRSIVHVLEEQSNSLLASRLLDNK